MLFLYASIRHLVPENCQVFGEWCYAKHSVVADLSEKYQRIVCAVVTQGGQVDEQGNVYWKF